MFVGLKKAKILSAKIVLVSASMMTLGCSGMEKLSSFRNSTLNNLNPAPSSLSPTPSVGVVDDLHLQAQADYYFTMAEAYSLSGEPKRSIEAYKSALVYDPQSITLRTRLATEYAKLGHVSEALEQAEAAMEINPTNLEARLVLGSLYSTLKMYDLALSQYFVAMDLAPEDFEAPMYIGAIYAEQHKYDEAIKHFSKLAKANMGAEKEFLFYYYMGRIRIEQGKKHYKQAEKFLSKSISLRPENATSTLALAKLYLLLKKEKAAMGLLGSYQESFVPKRDIAKVLADLYIEREDFEKAYEQLEIIAGYDPGNLNVKLRIALLLIKQEKNSEAVKKLKNILLVEPDSDKVRFYLGYTYQEVGELSLAVEAFQKVPTRSVFYTDAIARSVYILGQQGKNKEALKILQTAISKRKDSPTIYIFYATALEKMKRYDEALPVLQTASKAFESNIQIKFLLGTVYDHKGNKKKTIEVMKEILNIDPEHVQALNYLAYTYAVLGVNLQEAERLINRAVELKPKDGYILDTKGWVLFKQGKTREAITMLEAAYHLTGGESIITEHLGDAYFRHQLVEKARKMYIQAVRTETDAIKIEKIKSKLSAIENQIPVFQRRLPASTGNKK